MATRKPKTNVSTAKLFQTAESVLQRDLSVAERMTALGREFAALGCDGDFDALSRLPIAEDLAQAERWFATLFRAGKVPPKANALRFSLVEYTGEVHDFYVAALTGRGEEPSEWSARGAIYPQPRDAGTIVLSTILDPKGPIRNDLARHMTGLAYLASVAIHLCRKFYRKGDLAGRVVAAGYEDGDCEILGIVQKDGVVRPNPSGPIPAQKRIRLPPGQIFELERKAFKQSWLLGDLTNAETGKAVPYGFAQSARREKPRKLWLPIYHQGAPVDLNVTVLGVPVVTARFAELIGRSSPGSVQRMPVEVEGTLERFEVLNIIGTISARKLRDWSKKHRRPMADAELGKHQLVRVAEIDSIMLISRDLAQALIDENGVGFAFEPLRKDRFASYFER